MLFRLRWLQQEPFINDEKDGVRILGLDLLVRAIRTRQIELQEHIRQAHILCFVTLFAGFHTKCAGHVGLPTSGSACDEQVPVFGDVLTGCQPLNYRQKSVIGNLCIKSSYFKS